MTSLSAERSDIAANGMLIDELDLSPIFKKVCLPVEEGGYGWPEDAASSAIEDYRAFLHEIHEAEPVNGEMKKISPDPIVDIVWHTHILFTEKYHADCEAIFGKYIHHEPLI